MTSRLRHAGDAIWLRYSPLLPGPANGLELRAFALRRSGHHAVLRWILEQAGGWRWFLNDCAGEGNPFETCIRVNSEVTAPDGRPAHPPWEREAEGRLSKKGLLAYNYEDQDFRRVAPRLDVRREAWVGRSRRRHDLLILRDPFNLFASKLRWFYGQQHRPTLDELRTSVRLWKAYAEEFLGETHHLPNKVPISYNAWFADQTYRAGLAERLGLPFSDRGLNQVARWGPALWGDSFDGLAYDGRAQDMDVLERWKRFRDDDLYLSLVVDERLLALSERIFGEVPGVRALLTTR